MAMPKELKEMLMEKKRVKKERKEKEQEEFEGEEEVLKEEDEYLTDSLSREEVETPQGLKPKKEVSEAGKMDLMREYAQFMPDWHRLLSGGCHDEVMKHGPSHMDEKSGVHIAIILAG